MSNKYSDMIALQNAMRTQLTKRFPEESKSTTAQRFYMAGKDYGFWKGLCFGILIGIILWEILIG